MLSFKEFLETCSVESDLMLEAWPKVQNTIHDWESTSEEDARKFGALQAPVTITEVFPWKRAKPYGEVGRVGNQTVYLPSTFLGKPQMKMLHSILQSELAEKGSLQIRGRSGVFDPRKGLFPSSWAATAAQRSLAVQQEGYILMIVTVNNIPLSGLTVIVPPPPPGEEGSVIGKVGRKIDELQREGSVEVRNILSGIFKDYKIISSRLQDDLAILFSARGDKDEPGLEKAIYILPKTIDMIKNDRGTITHKTEDLHTAIGLFSREDKDPKNNSYLRALVNPGGPLQTGLGHETISKILDPNIGIERAWGPRFRFRLYIQAPSGIGRKFQGRMLTRSESNLESIFELLDNLAAGELTINRV